MTDLPDATPSDSPTITADPLMDALWLHPDDSIRCGCGAVVLEDRAFRAMSEGRIRQWRCWNGHALTVRQPGSAMPAPLYRRDCLGCGQPIYDRRAGVKFHSGCFEAHRRAEARERWLRKPIEERTYRARHPVTP